jgi:hypothetical protein
MKIIYEVTQNSDLTEGRGHQLTVGLFSDLVLAVKMAQGRGVMGHGTGDVHEVQIYDTETEFKELAKDFSSIGHYRKLIYGYRKDWMGRWNYGFVDNRDAPAIKDPDYEKYIELQKRLINRYGNVPGLEGLER